MSYSVLCDDCGRIFGGYRAYKDAHRHDHCASVGELHERGLERSRHGIWRQRPPEVVKAEPRQFRIPLRVPIASDGTNGEAR